MINTNFSSAKKLCISGHKDIDFVDIRLETDSPLYIDPERIALSKHPYASLITKCIDDFFDTLYRTALAHDDTTLEHLLSFAQEPNETHLGLSVSNSRGKGASSKALLSIIHDILQSLIFEDKLVKQLSDLVLWTPYFGPDRLSDLTTNIIREHICAYTLEQYKLWNIDFSETATVSSIFWDPEAHDWGKKDFPLFSPGGYPTLLVPKSFVCRNMLSSPGKLFQKYALRYRQKECLDQQSDLCHKKFRNGKEILVPPTKKELVAREVTGQCSRKTYLFEKGRQHPQMVDEMHFDNRLLNQRKPIAMSDNELDALLYASYEQAI